MCLVLKGGSLQRKCIPGSNLMHLSTNYADIDEVEEEAPTGCATGCCSIVLFIFSCILVVFTLPFSLFFIIKVCVWVCVSLESLFGKIQAVVQTGSTRISQIKCIAVSNHYLCSCMVAERVGTSTVARTRRSMNKVIYVLPSSWFSIKFIMSTRYCSGYFMM